MNAVGFNKPQVDRFFNMLTELTEKHNFLASRIYNPDETGVSCFHKNLKVLSVKRKQQVGKLTLGERGRNIMLMFSMNVTGQFIPPLYIFSPKKVDRNKHLMIGAPIDCIAIPCSSGWMNGDIFVKWLGHF